MHDKNWRTTIPFGAKRFAFLLNTQMCVQTTSQITMQLYTVDKWRGARHEVNPERSLCAFRVVYTVQDCVSWGGTVNGNAARSSISSVWQCANEHSNFLSVLSTRRPSIMCTTGGLQAADSSRFHGNQLQRLRAPRRGYTPKPRRCPSAISQTSIRHDDPRFHPSVKRRFDPLLHLSTPSSPVTHRQRRSTPQ